MHAAMWPEHSMAWWAVAWVAEIRGGLGTKGSRGVRRHSRPHQFQVTVLPHLPRHFLNWKSSSLSSGPAPFTLTSRGLLFS